MQDESKNWLNKVKKNIKDCINSIDKSHRSQAIELTEFELRELENLFVLLLLGAFTGIPSPLSMLAVELLPHLKHELEIMDKRAKDANDTLSELTGLLDIG